LNDKLPLTHGDEFIWACSSGDISFAKPKWINLIIDKIWEYPNRTFLFQSKNPECFLQYKFPPNVILGTTIETNRPYTIYSKAPPPEKRFRDFCLLDSPRKIVTIEPILMFDLNILATWMKIIATERIYIGYDTKNCNLIEPYTFQVKELCDQLKDFTKVKFKYMKFNGL